MTYTAWWDLDQAPIAGVGDVRMVIEDAADGVYPHGGQGISIRIGGGEETDAPLRIDIDAAVGRAAVSWRGVPGIEPAVEPIQTLTVGDDPYEAPVTIPAELARVTPARAIQAVEEYVRTGERPTCLEWKSE
ncbi:MAG TPA: Imm1 family immunity protein [Streptosporangiaceae bacterium]